MDNESSIDLEYKILLLGDSSSGKEDLLVRYTDNSFEDVQSGTVGVDVKYKVIAKDNKKIRLNIWNTSGQEKFHSLCISTVSGADGIILICDITNKETFRKFGNWLVELEELFHKGKVEIIIIANKIDLEDQRQISENELKEYGEKHNIKVFNASAKTGEGVEEAFDYLINRIINNKYCGNEGIRCNDENEFNNRKRSFKLIQRDNNKNTNTKKNNC